jgi:hypothetical protein
MDNTTKIKYQHLISKQKLSIDCPFKSCTPSTGVGFRWMFFPIENPNNFLPSILLNEKLNIPSRKNSPDDGDKCSSCALSMFDSERNAIDKFNNIPKHNREMLGYTHIASGIIDNLGLMTNTNKRGHFDFFEYEGIELRSVFTIVAELN